jgi:hypothetical protein
MNGSDQWKKIAVRVRVYLRNRSLVLEIKTTTQRPEKMTTTLS